jgi:HK97 family phage portal protein
VGIFSKLFKRSVKNDITGLTMDQFASMFAMPSWAGQDVTPETASRAIPVQACCALISGGITAMPLRIARRTLVDGSWLQSPADDHPYWWLFNESPDGEISAAQFWRRVLTHKLLFGESFARMNRSAGGRGIDVSQIIFVPNRQVQTLRRWNPVSRRAEIAGYKITANGRIFGVMPEDMLHFKDSQALLSISQQSLMGDGVSIAQPPLSAVLDSTRQAIGIVLAIEEYCGRFFSNGGMPKTVLKFPAGVKLDQKQIDTLRDSWVRLYGGAENSALPMVLNNGGDATKLSFTAEEAQMLEARKFQVIDIARGFGVPPFMIGETEKTSAWGSGIEQMSQAFIRYTLAPHIAEIEQESTRKLFGTARYCTDFDEEALARGDMKSLGEWFRQALGGAQGPGFMRINEVRRRMNLPDVPGGDEIYNPLPGGTNGNKSTSTPGTDSGEPGSAEAA